MAQQSQTPQKSQKQAPRRKKQVNGANARPRKMGPLGPVRKGPNAGGMGPYLRLLADPCAGEMVSPPYITSGSGYFYRVKSLFTPQVATTGGVAGTKTKANFIYQYTPSGNGANAVIFGGDPTANTNINLISGSPEWGLMNNGSVVDSFRVIASCIRFVPTGDITSRSGLVGRTYSQSPLYSAGAISYMTAEAARAMVTDPTGSANHEIRFLPGNADQAFHTTTVGAGDTNSQGTMVLYLLNVDALTTGTNTIVIQGYIEITTCYEWIPNAVTAPPTIKVSPRYTLNQVLTMLGDKVMDFVFGTNSSQGIVDVLSWGLRRQYGVAEGQNRLRIEL